MSDDLAFLTGGSGFVGGAVLRHLLADGRRVRALVRSETAATRLRAGGAEVTFGDLLDPGAEATLAAAMAGCRSVFHVAGATAICGRDDELLERVNVGGTRAVLRAAAAAGVERVVLTSSGSTIGEPAGVVACEDLARTGPDLTAYERSKRLAEELALELGPALGTEVVVVNPASVQGPGRLDGSARLLASLVRARMPVVVDTFVSLVDVEDCARGHVLAERHGRPGARYLLSGASLSTREALGAVRAATDTRLRAVRAPRPAVVAVGRIGDAALALGRPVPFCGEAARLVLHGRRYDGSRAAAELGLAYTPLEETLRRTVAWLRAQPRRR